MSTNLEYRARERERKRESRQASETQQEKGDRDLGREIKKQTNKQTKEVFFVGRTTKKCCSGGDNMRNASGHKCKVKMGGS